MAWWSRKGGVADQPKKSVPDGIWSKCRGCGQAIPNEEIQLLEYVCKECDFHERLPLAIRVPMIVDEDSFQEHDANLVSLDPLSFQVDEKHYGGQTEQAEKKSELPEAYVAGTAKIENIPVEIGFFAFEFMAGSMGSVVGEKITRQLERALEKKIPAVIFCASGGARMQEGVLSLMQMAKTSAVRAQMREQHVPLVTVLLDPTTGGVAASIAFLGDVILAEPNALIGFAGPRVIEQTIGQTLPKGFQRSEFLLEHGMIDRIAHRKELKPQLARVLRFLHHAHVS